MMKAPCDELAIQSRALPALQSSLGLEAPGSTNSGPRQFFAIFILRCRSNVYNCVCVFEHYNCSRSAVKKISRSRHKLLECVATGR